MKPSRIWRAAIRHRDLARPARDVAWEILLQHRAGVTRDELRPLLIVLRLMRMALPPRLAKAAERPLREHLRSELRQHQRRVSKLLAEMN